MVIADQSVPADIVDRLLWRDAQQMLGRHAEAGLDGNCVWCGWRWPCAPRRLAERADIVVENYRPDVKTRLGVDYDSLRELNPRLTVAGMLLTMHDARTKLAQDVEAEVRRHFPSLVFDTVIPRNVRLGEAPSFGRPVIHHDPACAGSEAYFELAKEVAARG